MENSFKPLPKDKFLDMTKLKSFADDKLNVAKMTISLSDTTFYHIPTIFLSF